MKKVLRSVATVAMIMLLSIKFCYATLYIIEVSDFQFTQNFDSILVGDTVKWVWVNGNHTTTSNGVPTGATPWNEILDEFHTSFTYVIPVQGTYNYISVPDAPQMGESFVATYPVGTDDLSMPVSNFSIIGNPSRNSVQYYFTLTRPAQVEVSLYDLAGVKVQSLYRSYLSAGFFQQAFSWQAKPGLYFLELRIGEARMVKQVVLQ